MTQSQRIKNRLSLACCTLLGSTPSVSSSQHSEPWQMNIGLANYIEYERNTGIEVIVNGQRAIDEDAINVKAELDVITGATPNGTTASNVPQTFTMSSGIGEYSVDAGELPADDTHMDMRMALSLQYNDEISSRLRIDYNTHLSMEFDYLSIGAGINIGYDLNNKNTTLLLGYDYEYNRVHPVGNIPIPLASMQPAGAPQPRDVAAATKRVDGISFGINQVLSRTSLLQLKFASSHASGYLTDPYKIVSVIESPSGRTLDYIFEHRPDQRQMRSVYIANKTYLGGDVLDLSYRYYQDEWDITSSTFDIRYRYRLNEQKFIQPNFRYYTQSSASFFAHSLPDSQPISAYISADFRMAKFDAYTAGIKLGKQTGINREHSLSIDYYTQIGDSHPDDAIGLQKQQDLFPTLHTLVLFYQYGFKW